MLREWAPLTELFNNLPTKEKKGLFYLDTKLTSVDVLPEFIALGTNLGIIYWFDRKRKHLTKLICETSTIPITCIKVLSTVDYMIACGAHSGNISIFQIPKSHPETLPENLKPKCGQIEKYTVTELHKTPVTALEWSKNGMKLFSGDRSGTVVLTELDFYMHICKSVEIINEAYEVVQLSYSYQHLLISTYYRSVICQQENKWKVSQVGKKDRKVLGDFGGLIIQRSCKPSDLYLYCSRPGLRIWIADIEGSVQNTLLFKELLSSECSEVQIINPIPKTIRSLKSQNEPSFGIILPFAEKFLVTYNSDSVFILDPEKMSIVATISQIRGVLDVSTYKDEIFILEEERSLIRISYNPEPEFSANFSASFYDTYLPTSIQDLTQRLQISAIKPAVPLIIENTSSNNISIYTDETSITYAEEATALPVKGRSVTPVQEKFSNIGKQEFSEDILFKKIRKGRKKSNMNSSITSISSTSSDGKETPNSVNSTFGLLPDERSPTSIIHDIEHKEKLLADVLKLESINIPPDKEDIVCVKNNSLSEDIETNLRHSHECKVEYNIKTPNPKSKEYKVRKELSSSETEVPVLLKQHHQVISRPSDMLSNNLTPTFATVPDQWNLRRIELRDRKNSTKSDNSLSDWEII